MNFRVGILGSGGVGQALAKGFLDLGHEVMIGTGSKSKHGELERVTSNRAKIGTFSEAAAFGEVVVLAVRGSAAPEVVRSVGKAGLAGKLVIDTTNPISDDPPINGVLRYFTAQNESLMEMLQKLAPKARFVKAFSCVGSPHMVDPDFGAAKPTMFICGNDEDAKSRVRTILERFGWEHEDMGTIEAARAIEPLAILWCIPGFRENRWDHALKLLRK